MNDGSVRGRQGGASFGGALRALFDASGLKRRCLAAMLGYDSSYISRWVNDVRLPSVRDNEALFDEIAAFFVDGAPSHAAELARAVHAPADAASDPDVLSASIASSLRLAYDRQELEGDRMQPARDCNALCSIGGSPLFDGLMESVAAETSEGPIEIATNSPVHLDFWGSRSFFQFLSKTKRVLRVLQFIDADGMRGHPVESVRGLLYLMSEPGGAEYSFYMLDASSFPSLFFAVKGSLLFMKADLPFLQGQMRTAVEDPGVVSAFWADAQGWTRNHRPVASRLPGNGGSVLRYGVGWAQSGYRCLLRTLPPELFPEEGVALDGGSREALARDLGSWLGRFDELLIYRGEVLDYLAASETGDGGVERRAALLREFARCAGESPCAVRMLDDENDVMCYDELCATVCWSRDRAYVQGMGCACAYAVSGDAVVAAIGRLFSALEGDRSTAAPDETRAWLEGCAGHFLRHGPLAATV